MELVTGKEFRERVPISKQGLQHWGKVGLYRAASRRTFEKGTPNLFSLEEFFKLAGIPKYRSDEKLINQTEAAKIFEENGYKFKYPSMVIRLARQGHFSAYALKKSAKGVTHFFFEKDILDFINRSPKPRYFPYVTIIKSLMTRVLPYLQLDDRDTETINYFFLEYDNKKLSKSQRDRWYYLERALRNISKKISRFIIMSEIIRNPTDIERENDILRKRIAEYESGDVRKITAKESSEFIDVAGDVLNRPIEYFGFSKRNMTCFQWLEFKTLKDLLDFGKEKYSKYRNVGVKSVTEIDDILLKMKLTW